MAKSALRSRVRFPHRLANSPPAKKSVMSVPNSFSSSAFGTFTAKCRAVSGTRGPSPVIPKSRCQFVPPPPTIYNGSRPDAAGGRSGTIHPHRGGREGDPGPARPLPPQGRVFADGGSRRRVRVGEGEDGEAGNHRP